MTKSLGIGRDMMGNRLSRLDSWFIKCRRDKQSSSQFRAIALNRRNVLISAILRGFLIQRQGTDIHIPREKEVLTDLNVIISIKVKLGGCRNVLQYEKRLNQEENCARARRW